MMIVVMDLMKLAVPRILQVWLCTELGKGVNVLSSGKLSAHYTESMCACTLSHTHVQVHMFNIDPSHCHEAWEYETCHSAIKNMLIYNSHKAYSKTSRHYRTKKKKTVFIIPLVK